MKKATIFTVSVFTLFVVLFDACTTPQKLYEQGNYDEAIGLAVEKLRARQVKDRDVTTLVEAFNYINRRDIETLTRLESSTSPSKSAEMFDLASRVQHRQDLVKPLISLNDDKYFGKLENLYFSNSVAAQLADARENAAADLYNQATGKLELSKTSNNRRLAREAYDQFGGIKKYFDTYRDAQQLAEEAYTVGINHVYVQVENDSRSALPADFEKALESVFVRDLNTKWVKYHTFQDEKLRYDYTVVARMTRIEVSPDAERRDHHVEEAQVEDGFDYVLDAHGNVKKDSLGNDLKVKKFRFVRADVFEVRQTKEANVFGFLEYFDNRTHEKVLSRPIEAAAAFRNIAVHFDGDRRALHRETCDRLGGSPQPFPTDAAMLLTAAENLKDVTKRIIRDNSDLVSR